MGRVVETLPRSLASILYTRKVASEEKHRKQSRNEELSPPPHRGELILSTRPLKKKPTSYHQHELARGMKESHHSGYEKGCCARSADCWVLMPADGDGVNGWGTPGTDLDS